MCSVLSMCFQQHIANFQSPFVREIAVTCGMGNDLLICMTVVTELKDISLGTWQKNIVQ